MSTDSFTIEIRVLRDLLDKKQTALSQILAICENQETLYMHPPSPERTEFSKEIAMEKQRLIEIVLECDDVFQSIFTRLKPTFEAEAEKQPALVTALQARIKEVMETDIRIRAQEERNKQLLAAESAGRGVSAPHTPVVTKPRAYVLDQYAKHKRPGS